VLNSSENESIYRTLLENSPDAVYCLEDMIFRYVNPTGAHLLGYETPEELIGKDAVNTVHPEYKQIMIERNRARQRGEPQPNRYESKLLRKDGSSIDVEFHIASATVNGRTATITS